MPKQASTIAAAALCPASLSIIDLSDATVPDQTEGTIVIDLVDDSHQTNSIPLRNGSASPNAHATPASKRRKCTAIDITGQAHAADAAKVSSQTDQHSAAASTQPLGPEQHKLHTSDREIAKALRRANRQAQQDQVPLPASQSPEALHMAAPAHDFEKMIWQEQHHRGKQAHHVSQNRELLQRNALLMQQLEKLQVTICQFLAP